MENIVYPTLGREELNLTVAAGQHGAGELHILTKRWQGGKFKFPGTNKGREELKLTVAAGHGTDELHILTDRCQGGT
jgi:hypothetical protein